MVLLMQPHSRRPLECPIPDDMYESAIMMLAMEVYPCAAVITSQSCRCYENIDSDTFYKFCENLCGQTSGDELNPPVEPTYPH